MSAPALLAALAAAPQASWACIPPTDPDFRSSVKRGPACAVSHHLDEITTISLGVAEDLGGGLAAQTLVDGNACYAEVYAIVTDCRSGEAVAIGATGGRDSPRQWDIVGRALDEAEVAAASGGPVSVASLSTSSTAAGADQRLVLSARDTIEQGGVQFTLGFACDLLYPDAGTRP